MWETIVNGFWIVVSGILALALICLVVYLVWKALEMNEAEREKAARIDPAKETKDLKFVGVSRWEMNMEVGRLLREDKKRQKRRRYDDYKRSVGFN